MRLKNIDLLKGLLILLVICGHVLPDALSKNIWRYIIYSFHMPVFIAISGLLFNSLKIRLLSLRDLLSRYLFRVIVPWVIAVIGYLILVNGPGLTHAIHPSVIVKSFTHPYYHLWFIPAFLSWVFLTWLAQRMAISTVKLLIISGLSSLFFYILFLFPQIYEKTAFNIPVELVLHTFRPYFYVFFVFGSYLRDKEKFYNPTLNTLIIVSSFAGIVLLFFYPNKIITILLFYLFNLSFLLFLSKKAKEDYFIHSKWIEWLGANSLAIYLWHVAPIIILKFAIDSHNPFYYPLSILTELLFILIVFQLTKIKVVNKYLFGME